MVGLAVGWVVGCVFLVGWMVCWLGGWSVGWFVGWLCSWLACWLIKIDKIVDVTVEMFRIPDTAECTALQLKAEKDGTADTLYPVATHSVKGQTLFSQTKNSKLPDTSDFNLV